MSPESTASLSVLILLGLLVAFVLFNFFFPLKFSLDLIHNELFPVPLFYFLVSFSGFQYLFPSQQYFPGTCFALSSPPWILLPNPMVLATTCQLMVLNPHLQCRSFIRIQIHLSPVSWVCQEQGLKGPQVCQSSQAQRGYRCVCWDSRC